METNKQKLTANQKRLRSKPKHFKLYQFLANFFSIMISSILVEKFLPNCSPFWASGRNLLIFLICIAIYFIFFTFTDKALNYFCFKNNF